MIIKINLLPRHFFEKRAVRIMAVVMAIFFLVVMGSLFAYSSSLKKDLAQKTQETANMKTQADKVDAINSEATQITSGEIPTIKVKTQFVEDVDHSNASWADLLDTLSRYTYRGVTYNSITPSGNTITIEAHADDVSTVGRYLLGMLRCPLFTYVSIGSVPAGYPAGTSSSTGITSTAAAPGVMGGMPGMPGMGIGAMPGAGSAAATAAGTPSEEGVTFTVTCTLKKSITIPDGSSLQSGGSATGSSATGTGAGAAGSPMGAPAGSAAGGAPGGAPAGGSSPVTGTMPGVAAVGNKGAAGMMK